MLIDLRDGALQALVEDSRPFHERFEANLPSAPPDLSTPEGVEQARRMADAYARLRADEPPVVAEDRTVRVAGRSVDVRILRPPGELRGVYLDVHGGGFFLGSASMGDKRNHDLCTEHDLAVVSVEYRLAPEHPWPAGPDDCETAAMWLLEQAGAEFGSEALAIGGASAGATLAAVTLLRVRDRHDAIDRFLGANLVYGVYDLSGTSPSGRTSVESRRFYLDAYLRDVPQDERVRPDVSPLYGDLRGMPPALFSVGDRDTLYEDNVAMAMRWASAGGRSELVVYPESPHAFNTFPTPMAAEANRRMGLWVADRFA